MPPGTCSRDEAQVNNNNKNKTKINSGIENERKQTKKISLNIASHLTSGDLTAAVKNSDLDIKLILSKRLSLPILLIIKFRRSSL